MTFDHIVEQFFGVQLFTARDPPDAYRTSQVHAFVDDFVGTIAPDDVAARCLEGLTWWVLVINFCDIELAPAYTAFGLVCRRRFGRSLQLVTGEEVVVSWEYCGHFGVENRGSVRDAVCCELGAAVSRGCFGVDSSTGESFLRLPEFVPSLKCCA